MVRVTDVLVDVHMDVSDVPNVPPLHIRKARRKDRFAMKLLNENNLSENYSLEFWTDLLTNYPGKSLVLENAQGELKGYLLSNGSLLCSFVVDGSVRNCGWGSQLLERWCSIPDLQYPLELQVRTTNQAALHLYEKYGFETVDTLSQYYKNPTADAYLMRKTKQT